MSGSEECLRLSDGWRRFIRRCGRTNSSPRRSAGWDRSILGMLHTPSPRFWGVRRATVKSGGSQRRGLKRRMEWGQALAVHVATWRTGSKRANPFGIPTDKPTVRPRLAWAGIAAQSLLIETPAGTRASALGARASRRKESGRGPPGRDARRARTRRSGRDPLKRAEG